MGKDALCLCSHCVTLWLAISYLPLAACLLYFSHSGMWGFVNVNALKHLHGEKSSQKSSAVHNESILWILPFLSLSVINNTPQAVCYLECWVVFCWPMGILWNVSQIHWEDTTRSKLPVLRAEHSPGVLTGGQTTAHSLHPAFKIQPAGLWESSTSLQKAGSLHRAVSSHFPSTSMHWQAGTPGWWHQALGGCYLVPLPCSSDRVALPFSW